MEQKLMLVDAAALPEVYERVLAAKELLASGEAGTAAQAARQAGISRSAFYKYKDSVFPYDGGKAGKLLTVHLQLRDHPGVLSSVLAAFAAAGTNILTVNQNIPAGGSATVSVAARIERIRVPADEFIKSLGELAGVQRIIRINNE